MIYFESANISGVIVRLQSRYKLQSKETLPSGASNSEPYNLAQVSQFSFYHSIESDCNNYNPVWVIGPPVNTPLIYSPLTELLSLY